MFVKGYCAEGQVRDTRLGPQWSNPTSDDGQSPHPKDQYEDEEQYDEFWQRQIRQESYLHLTKQGEPEFWALPS